jgi:hypothetical protein
LLCAGLAGGGLLREDTPDVVWTTNFGTKLFSSYVRAMDNSGCIAMMAATKN